MNERVKEIAADAVKYIKQAAAGWWDGVDYNPGSHALTAIAAIVLWEIGKRIV